MNELTGGDPLFIVTDERFSGMNGKIGNFRIQIFAHCEHHVENEFGIKIVPCQHTDIRNCKTAQGDTVNLKYPISLYSQDAP